MSTNSTKPTYTQILVASSIGLILAAAMHFCFKRIRDQKIIPKIKASDTGQILHIKKFSHYVARQMGFNDRRECPHLCKLSSEYIRKTEGCEEDMYEFFASEPDADSLFIKLVEEFERCILSYFTFHWGHTSYMLSQGGFYCLGILCTGEIGIIGCAVVWHRGAAKQRIGDEILKFKVMICFMVLVL